MVSVYELKGKATIKLDVALKLLETMDNLNKKILESDEHEIRAITDGIEDFAFTIKKLFEEESESK